MEFEGKRKRKSRIHPGMVPSDSLFLQKEFLQKDGPKAKEQTKLRSKIAREKTEKKQEFQPQINSNKAEKIEQTVIETEKITKENNLNGSYMRRYPGCDWEKIVEEILKDTSKYKSGMEELKEPCLIHGFKRYEKKVIQKID